MEYKRTNKVGEILSHFVFIGEWSKEGYTESVVDAFYVTPDGKTYTVPLGAVGVYATTESGCYVRTEPDWVYFDLITTNGVVIFVEKLNSLTKERLRYQIEVS